MNSLKEKLKRLLTGGLDSSFYENLTDLLIEADLGPALAVELCNNLQRAKFKTQADAIASLGESLKSFLKEESLIVNNGELSVILLLGVNGVGKTTTLAKLAAYYKNLGIRRVIAAAGDTFRAAAAEQLSLHGERGGFRVVRGESGGDPGAVIFDAITAAGQDGLVLADTAGRMHNKIELVNELKKIDKIVLSKVANPDRYSKILVLDATTGQNGVRQAESFHEAVGLSGLALTKYDGSSKGGMIAAVGRALALPVYFVGTGEKMTDLAPFNREAYLNDLLK